MAITRRTKPQFLLTNHTPVEVVRNSPIKGEYVDGEWVEGPKITFTIEANVQPMSNWDLLQMPESERTKEWIKIYSAEEIRKAVEGPGGHEADHILWDGEVYRVMKLKSYKMGVLDHWHGMAARVPTSAQG